MVLNEPSFFFLLHTVDTKSLWSLWRLMMTPFCKSFSISAFMIRFSCLLWGIFGDHVIFGLSINSILKPFLIISRIILSLVIFFQSEKRFLKFQAVKSGALTFFSSVFSFVGLPVTPSLSSRALPGRYTIFGYWLQFWCWYVVLLPLLYPPVWFAASLYDTVWIGFVSKALLVLFICLTLLFRSSPKSSSGPFLTFFANCFIQPGNFGSIVFLLNWLVALAACARKARAFISGVRNSLLRSILYLTNHPITILATLLLKGVPSFFWREFLWYITTQFFTIQRYIAISFRSSCV